jgi:hypothetical protein
VELLRVHRFDGGAQVHAGAVVGIRTRQNQHLYKISQDKTDQFVTEINICKIGFKSLQASFRGNRVSDVMDADPEPGLGPILKDNKILRVSDPDSIWSMCPDLGRSKRSPKK